MLIDVVTLFPNMFNAVFGESIVKRAIDNKILTVRLTQLRDFAFGKHRQVDDSPFGGGAGMVLKPEPIYRAVRSILESSADSCSKQIIVMDPRGRAFNQIEAKELSKFEQLIFVCGHYEGFDSRVYDIADRVISIGDYVLTGGELPTMVVIDAVVRMLPKVLGSSESAITDSFFERKLGIPQYTRPRDFEGKLVPEILLSGDHAKIKKWREEQSDYLTRVFRPDLLETKKSPLE